MRGNVLDAIYMLDQSKKPYLQATQCRVHAGRIIINAHGAVCILTETPIHVTED